MRHMMPGEPDAVAQGGAPVTAPAPGTPASIIDIPGRPPTTLTDMRDLRARRSEISSQLSNVTGRRNDLASQLRTAAPGADRAGIEGRIAALDTRIIELENNLNVTGQQLALARGAAAIQPDQPSPQGNMPDADQMTAIAIVFTIAVLMPLSIAWARAIFRRSARSAEQPSRELMQRLDRMEEGIEAIAIEVERVSEGQRFVTKVIGQGAAPALGAGAAEPVAVPRGDKVRVERGS